MITELQEDLEQNYGLPIHLLFILEQVPEQNTKEEDWGSGGLIPQMK